jgi:hypothetical protein
MIRKMMFAQWFIPFFRGGVLCIFADIQRIFIKNALIPPPKEGNEVQ